MKTLIQRIAREMGGLAIRHAPTYSSQAQGSIERLHATLFGQVRVLRQHVEHRYEISLPAHHPANVVDGTTRRVATKSLLAARRRPDELPKAVGTQLLLRSV